MSELQITPKDHSLRTRLIQNILKMKKLDPDYARFALQREHERMPWMDLMNGVREAMK